MKKPVLPYPPERMNTQTNINDHPRSMDYFKEPDGLTKRIERIPG